MRFQSRSPCGAYVDVAFDLYIDDSTQRCDTVCLSIYIAPIESMNGLESAARDALSIEHNHNHMFQVVCAHTANDATNSNAIVGVVSHMLNNGSQPRPIGKTSQERYFFIISAKSHICRVVAEREAEE